MKRNMSRRSIFVVAAMVLLLPATTRFAWSASFQYDNGDRLISVSYSARRSISYSYDAAGNITAITAQGYPVGDINQDEYVDLKDAVATLQLLAGAKEDVTSCLDCAAGGNDKIGLNDVIYTLQAIVGLRTP